MFKTIVTIASMCVILGAGYFGAGEYRVYKDQQDRIEERRTKAEEEAAFRFEKIMADTERDLATEGKRVAIIRFMLSEGSRSYTQVVEYINHWCSYQMEIDIGSEMGVKVSAMTVFEENGYAIDMVGKDHQYFGHAGEHNSPKTICSQE